MLLYSQLFTCVLPDTLHPEAKEVRPQCLAGHGPSREHAAATGPRPMTPSAPEVQTARRRSLHHYDDT